MSIKEITSLLKSLKLDIGDEYHADEEIELPSMLVTVATSDGETWSFQTGDTSYTGGCYSYRHWSRVTLERRSNCHKLARGIVRELRDLVAEEKSYEK